uniref:Uncharacterized protein n=1 Tax=Solanum lycopersicum TaxID=4081 RepID=A0A494G984_SOLLC
MPAGESQVSTGKQSGDYSSRYHVKEGAGCLAGPAQLVQVLVGNVRCFEAGQSDLTDDSSDATHFKSAPVRGSPGGPGENWVLKMNNL